MCVCNVCVMCLCVCVCVCRHCVIFLKPALSLNEHLEKCLAKLRAELQHTKAHLENTKTLPRSRSMETMAPTSDAPAVSKAAKKGKEDKPK